MQKKLPDYFEYLSTNGTTSCSEMFHFYWYQCYFIILFKLFFIFRDGVSLKPPRPRGWVRAGRPSGGESSFNKRNMYQYPHVSQLFILTSVAKPGIPGAIKNGWVCTADYRMLLGTAVRPVPARIALHLMLCDVGATDVKRWWWWWFLEHINNNITVKQIILILRKVKSQQKADYCLNCGVCISQFLQKIQPKSRWCHICHSTPKFCLFCV